MGKLQTIENLLNEAREKLANSPLYTTDGNAFEALLHLADAIEELSAEVFIEPKEYDFSDGPA